ncbi:hypothetical protein C6P88_11950 [Burkholderia contaminans]|uniref:Uncharacterized protein n=1 Tax=Burkholderia contaminans TaxID=488447 RepID=A0A2S5E580_9BURK|nr:hypothetical protein C3743_08750 [Burkholderia contaminans]PRD93775.1 hypothetical protein C6P88_11950 [Burkholderia contaminans]
MDERRRGERTGVLRTEVKRIGKDQPMIESGAGAVYEAIVRRKSRAAIWRAAMRDRRCDRAPGRPPGRNLGLGAGRIPKSRPAGRGRLSADETKSL